MRNKIEDTHSSKSPLGDLGVLVTTNFNFS
jgi:hypothetical protein